MHEIKILCGVSPQLKHLVNVVYNKMVQTMTSVLKITRNRSNYVHISCRLCAFKLKFLTFDAGLCCCIGREAFVLATVLFYVQQH